MYGAASLLPSARRRLAAAVGTKSRRPHHRERPQRAAAGRCRRRTGSRSARRPRIRQPPPAARIHRDRCRTGCPLVPGVTRYCSLLLPSRPRRPHHHCGHPQRTLIGTLSRPEVDVKIQKLGLDVKLWIPSAALPGDPCSDKSDESQITTGRRQGISHGHRSKAEAKRHSRHQERGGASEPDDE